jgi:hypothetical protein
MPSLKEQITEVKRELSMREHVYPRWVSDGRLDPAESVRRLERMRAVLQTLVELQGHNEPVLFTDEDQGAKR